MNEIPEEKRLEILSKYAELARQEIESAGTTSNLEAKKNAEIASLTSRGVAYLNKKHEIEQRYAKMLPQAPAQVDAELEEAKESGTLEKLYRARLSKIRRGDLNAVTKLQTTFKKAGLQL